MQGCQVLYVCAICGRARSKWLEGKFALEDLLVADERGLSDLVKGRADR